MTTDEMLQVAQDAYEFIKDSTTGPKDGAQVILMIHVILWLNHRDGDTTADKMLADYTSDFLDNYRRNLNA